MEKETLVWTACRVKECDHPIFAGGLCRNHHRRNRLYGSPVAGAHQMWRKRQFTPEERFWANVRKTEDGCWLWQASIDKHGYGYFRGIHGGVVFATAHRYSYAIHNSDFTPRLHVCHKCDVPACVRPDHLFLGTAADNHADRATKGRTKGELSSRAILTEEQAKAILNDPRPHPQIAEEYGVHPGTISSLKMRVSWQHLGSERGVKAKRVSPRKGVSDKINPDIVRTIRASAEAGKDLAIRYGTSPQTITDIRKRRSWAHVD